MTGKSLDSTASTIINYFNKHPDEFPNELVDNIGKVKEKYKYTTHYENGELKSVDKGDDIPIDASEECPPLGNYTLYYKKDGSQIVINPSGSGAPSGFNTTDWVSTSINKRYDPYMDLVKETITETDCLKFKIGDTSTQADMLKYKRPDLHTDKIFKIESFREVTHTRLDKPATGGAFGGGVEHYSRGTSHTTLEAVADGFISNPISPYEKGISYDIQTPDHALKVYEHARGVSERMSHERGTIGALQNRLEHSVNTSTIASENTSNARSRINDTDMAKEIAKFTMNNVANQAAQAMLSQANSQPQNILSLLQG